MKILKCKTNRSKCLFFTLENTEHEYKSVYDFVKKIVRWSYILIHLETSQSTGTTPVDQLKRGMRLELQHAINPVDVWLVKVIENVGGRLYLRLEGAESGSHDFWLFYLNHRIHPIGWAKANGYKYSPPPGMFLVWFPSCL